MWSFCQSLTWDAFVMSPSWILQHQCPAKKHQQKIFEAFKQGSPWITIDHMDSIQWSVLHCFFSFAQEIGSCVLFYGPPGTGKSLAAQAIGFEARFAHAGWEHILNRGWYSDTTKNKETLKDSPQVGINSEYWVLNMIVYYLYIYWLITGVFWYRILSRLRHCLPFQVGRALKVVNSANIVDKRLWLLWNRAGIFTWIQQDLEIRMFGEVKQWQVCFSYVGGYDYHDISSQNEIDYMTNSPNSIHLRLSEQDLTNGPLMSVYLGTFQHGYLFFVCS